LGQCRNLPCSTGSFVFKSPHRDSTLTWLQMQQASSAFSGVAFHCYAGDFTNQSSFTGAYPNKEVYFTECTGTVGTDWWSDIKWNMYHLWVHPTDLRPQSLLNLSKSFVGSTDYSSRTILLWNLAAHANGSPRLPGTDSCATGCR
jgi:O-glycosyl hydrolase